MAGFGILQFNMQYGQCWDEKDPNNAPIQLDNSIKFIQSHQADIVCLQEVEHARDGACQPEPPIIYTQIKAAMSDYHSYFRYPPPDARELPFGFGLAIFSKTPLENTFSQELPAPPIEFDFYGKTTSPTRRLLIGAQTSIQGHPLQIFNTHLQAFFMINATSNDYPEQRNVIAKLLKQTELPAILAGDFNSAPNESLVEQYEELGFKTTQKEEITWKRMPYVLDHVFYNTSLKLEQSQVIDTDTSDHHALLAHFSFQKP